MEESLRRRGSRRLRIWAVGLPVALIVLLEAVRRLVLSPLLGAARAADATLATAVAGVVVFSLIIWHVVERTEAGMAAAYDEASAHARQLVALHEAALSVTAALDLPTVLQRVVDESCAVIGARYGAVAVVGQDGSIEEFVTSGLDAEIIGRLGAPPTGHGLLGLVVSERRALRVDDIAAHPRSVGFPPLHPPMKILLAVPLFFQESVLGSIYLTDPHDGQPFGAGDQEILERFAAQAAIAVANARLHGEVGRLSLVEERERISMDLHDGVLQTLYATGLELEMAMEDVDRQPASAKQGVERAIDRLHTTISDIRHYIFDLRTAQEEDGPGLVALLRQLADSLPHPGVDLDLEAQTPFAGVPRRIQWECWHIAREAVSNAVRHSGCRRVAIRLHSAPDELRLEVADDGSGFDSSLQMDETHRGLRNMRRRADAVGGALNVASEPGHGATVTLAVPIQAGGGS